MDHPCEHTNDAVLPAIPLEEPVREAASTSASPDVQAPSLPQDTPAFQVPSHSQHEDNLRRKQLTAEQKEEHMRIYRQLMSQENPVKQVQIRSLEYQHVRRFSHNMDHPCEDTNDAVLPAVPLEEPVREEASTSASPDIQAPSLPQDTLAALTFQVPSHSQHEDILPQLTAEHKEDMRIYKQLASQENPINQVRIRYLEYQHVRRFSHNMDHPYDHINDAVLPAVLLEERVREAASTSASPHIQAPSLPQDTPAFQVPSHSHHEDYLPQLTAEQKEELMRIHTEITSQENPVNQDTSFEFEEPRDQTDVYNAIFKEPQDRVPVNLNAIWREPQDKAEVSNSIRGETEGKSDDSKSISGEGSNQEEWTPEKKRKQGRHVKRKYTKQNSAKTQDNKGS